MITPERLNELSTATAALTQDEARELVAEVQRCHKVLAANDEQLVGFQGDLARETIRAMSYEGQAQRLSRAVQVMAHAMEPGIEAIRQAIAENEKAVVQEREEGQARCLCPLWFDCDEHGRFHGGEAEELRMGIEAIIKLPAYEKEEALRKLLDETDSRDSLAWCQHRERERLWREGHVHLPDKPVDGEWWRGKELDRETLQAMLDRLPPRAKVVVGVANGDDFEWVTAVPVQLMDMDYGNGLLRLVGRVGPEEEAVLIDQGQEETEGTLETLDR